MPLESGLMEFMGLMLVSKGVVAAEEWRLSTRLSDMIPTGLCGVGVITDGNVSDTFASSRGRNFVRPPLKLDMRFKNCCRYPEGPISNDSGSKGTQDITSVNVQATSKIFSICIAWSVV